MGVPARARSVDRELLPGRAAILIESEFAHDRPDGAVGQRQLGGKPDVARGVGIGQREALFQAFQHIHGVKCVVDGIVREDASLGQQEHEDGGACRP